MSELEKDETPITPNTECDSDTNPTIQEMFDQEKKWLLDDIHVLLRLVSEMELDNPYDEDLGFCDELSHARCILRRLKHINRLNGIVG